MRTHLCGRSVLTLLLASLFLIVFALPAAFGQDPVVAKVGPRGALVLMSGDRALATLTLNAHGAGWKHVEQDDATAALKDLDPGPGRVCEGNLAVPDTDGGAVRFREVVRPIEKGLSLAYELGFSKALSLNGLQVSLYLSPDAYAGKEVAITSPAAQDQAAAVTRITLPAEVDQQKWQLGMAAADKVEIAAGTDQAITLTPKLPQVEGKAAQPAMFIVQDLRRWNTNAFEIRWFLIMDDKGKQVTADEAPGVAFTLGFPRELRLE